MKTIFALLLFAAFSAFNVHAQVIGTFGGNNKYDYGDGNEALLAAIHNPWAMAVDDSGNLYFSEPDACVVRKIDAGGIISRVAGCGSPGYSGDYHKATAAQLNGPSGIAFDHKGNLFIADSKNNVIRKVNLHNNNIITTAYMGFTTPTDLAFDSYDNLYVCDASNNTIQKIDAYGHVTTVASGFGAVTWTGGYGGTPGTSGPRFVGLTFDKYDNLYVTDLVDNIIRKIAHEGGMTVIAGNSLAGKTDNCLAVNASLSGPTRVTAAPNGNIVFTDINNCRVCQVDSSGMLTTIVGSYCGYAGDGGSAKNASIDNPAGVVYDRNGIMYIADNGNARIRKVSPWAAAVNDVRKDASIAIAPNPSNGSFTISARATMPDNNGAMLTVIGMAGNLVYQGTMKQDNNGFRKSVSLGEEVASGNYLVVVKTAGETMTSHLVIER